MTAKSETTESTGPCPPLPGDEEVTEDHLSRRETEADYDADEKDEDA